VRKVALAAMTGSAIEWYDFFIYLTAAAPVGLVIGNAVFLLLSALFGEAAFAACAWRLPFLFSVVLIAVALFIQLRLEDTPVFRQLAERQEEGEESESSSPVIEVLTQHPRQILLAAGAFFVVNGGFYVLITGMLDYGTRVLGISQNVMLGAVLVSAVVEGFAIVAMSALSDRVGRRTVFMAGAVLLAVWSFPLLWLVNTGSLVLIVIALCLAQFFQGMMYGPQAALFAEMFSARVRYSGASIGYQGASVFAGGLAPIIMVWLLDTTGTSPSISFYLLAMCAITFFSACPVTETYEDEMTQDQSQEGAEEETGRHPPRRRARGELPEWNLPSKEASCTRPSCTRGPPPWWTSP
jgi:MHS family shikimate/dehydroshikimate transporter-like MFS transporter